MVTNARGHLKGRQSGSGLSLSQLHFSSKSSRTRCYRGKATAEFASRCRVGILLSQMAWKSVGVWISHCHVGWSNLSRNWCVQHSKTSFKVVSSFGTLSCIGGQDWASMAFWFWLISRVLGFGTHITRPAISSIVCRSSEASAEGIKEKESALDVAWREVIVFCERTDSLRTCENTFWQELHMTHESARVNRHEMWIRSGMPKIDWVKIHANPSYSQSKLPPAPPVIGLIL